MSPSIWHLPEHPKTVFCGLRADKIDDPDTLLASLSTGERERYSRIAVAANKQRFLVGRHGLRSLLATRLQIAPHEVSFRYTRFRKPVSDAGCWHFNVSHSGHWVFIALHPELPIGVDLEMPRKLRRPIELLQRLGENESNLPDPNQSALELWVRVEAALKAVGRGIAGLDELRRDEVCYLWRGCTIRVSSCVFKPHESCVAAFALMQSTPDSK